MVLREQRSLSVHSGAMHEGHAAEGLRDAAGCFAYMYLHATLCQAMCAVSGTLCVYTHKTAHTFRRRLISVPVSTLATLAWNASLLVHDHPLFY